MGDLELPVPPRHRPPDKFGRVEAPVAPGLTPEQFVQRAQARTAQCSKLCRYAEFTDCTNLLPSTGRNVRRACAYPPRSRVLFGHSSSTIRCVYASLASPQSGTELILSSFLPIPFRFLKVSPSAFPLLSSPFSFVSFCTAIYLIILS